MSFGDDSALGKSNSVALPEGVIRPIRPTEVVYQRFPSGPEPMQIGELCSVGNSRMVPSASMRPIV